MRQLSISPEAASVLLPPSSVLPGGPNLSLGRRERKYERTREKKGEKRTEQCVSSISREEEEEEGEEVRIAV